MLKTDPKHIWETYEDEEAFLEEVPRCGTARYRRATGRGFDEKRVSAPESYEIYFVSSGGLGLLVDGRLQRARKHMTIFVRPYESVAGVGPRFAVGPCEVSWVELALPPLEGEHWLSESQRKELVENLARIDRTVFPISPRTVECCEQLVAEHRQQQSQRLLTGRSLLMLLLSGLLRGYHDSIDMGEVVSGFVSPEIQETLDWIERHLADRVLVENMARQAGMQVRRFHSIFLEEVGYTPSDYVNCQRVERARHLLVSSSLSVTAIGLELGFSSGQYFASVFRKYTATTPSEYRRDMRDR